MKLSYIFPVYFLYTSVQNVYARPYPEESSSWSSWLLGLPASVSGYYREASTYLGNYGISAETADLITKGSSLADRVLDVVSFVPGLEPVTLFGKLGLKAVQFLGNTTVQAVNMIEGKQPQDSAVDTNVLASYANGIFDLGSQFSKFSDGIENINSRIEKVLKTITEMIDKIRNFFTMK